VSNDNISFLCAASGVIAKYVDGLLAQRAGDFMIQNRNSETMGDGNLEVSGTEQSFFAVFVTRDCGDKAAGVWLSCAAESLCSTSVSLVD